MATEKRSGNRKAILFPCAVVIKRRDTPSWGLTGNWVFEKLHEFASEEQARHWWNQWPE